MLIRFYNSLTKSEDPFEPIEPGVVSMYTCGPTVYDYAHIGNFRSFLFADVLRRFLERAGCDVHHVMNLTDVGHMTDDAVADGSGQDKMAAAGQRLKEAKKTGDAHAAAIANPDDPYEVAQFYIDAFLHDAKLLRLKVADEYPDRMPRATDHVPQMIDMIQTLVDQGDAYVAADGAVYFAVDAFPAYGRLSGNTLDQLQGGAGGRLSDEHQAVKRNPADFLLWKPDPSHLMKWDSPWGAGYPGWHIECSAMARHVLQHDVIDLHTGGEDNIFPHHECEIAQSCACTGHDTFARFWLHGRHLMIEGEKMSKSKGNFFTVRQVLAGDFTGRPVDPAVLRYELIKSRYNSQSNLTRQGLEDSGRNVRRLRELDATLAEHAAEPAKLTNDHPAVARFLGFLADDLNIAGALGALFEYLNDLAGDENPAEVRGVLHAVNDILGVLPIAATDDADPWRDEKLAAMLAARAAKDWAASDAIRAELIDAGYDVNQSKDGTTATKRLA